MYVNYIFSISHTDYCDYVDLCDGLNCNLGLGLVLITMYA